MALVLTVLLAATALQVQSLVIPTFEKGVPLKHPLLAPAAEELETTKKTIDTMCDSDSDVVAHLRRNGDHCASEPVSSAAIGSTAPAMPRFEDLFAAVVLAAFACWMAASSTEARLSEIELTVRRPPTCKPSAAKTSEGQDDEQTRQPPEQQDMQPEEAAVSKETEESPSESAGDVANSVPAAPAQDEPMKESQDDCGNASSKPSSSLGASCAEVSADPAPEPAVGARAEGARTGEAAVKDEPSPLPYKYVRIMGIERRPELNGQVGLVASIDNEETSGERRYTIRVGESQFLKLRHSKLCPLSEMEYLHGVLAAAKTRCGSEAGEEAVMKIVFASLPMGEFTAKGTLIPSYTWAQVPAAASVPPGVEVWMPPRLGMRAARIPTKWRLQVVDPDRVESYRCDVQEHTALAEVRRGAAAFFGWDDAATVMLADDNILPDMATVGSAMLFGRRVTARKTA